MNALDAMNRGAGDVNRLIGALIALTILTGATAGIIRLAARFLTKVRLSYQRAWWVALEVFLVGGVAVYLLPLVVRLCGFGLTEDTIHILQVVVVSCTSAVVCGLGIRHQETNARIGLTKGVLIALSLVLACIVFGLCIALLVGIGQVFAR